MPKIISLSVFLNPPWALDDAVNKFFSIKPNIQQHIDMPLIFNMYNDFLSHAHSV